MKDRHDDGHWADWCSTCALTGIEPCDLAWAMARGQIDYSLDRPGHEGVPMILVDAVQSLLAADQRQPQLRVVP